MTLEGNDFASLGAWKLACLFNISSCEGAPVHSGQGSEATYPQMFFLYPDHGRKDSKTWRTHTSGTGRGNGKARKVGPREGQRELAADLPVLGKLASYGPEAWVGPRLCEKQ